jgi:hypothetical protein
MSSATKACWYKKFEIFYSPVVHREIDWSKGYVSRDKELQKLLAEQLSQYEEEKSMPYVTSVERLARAQGREQGREQGLLEGIEAVCFCRLAFPG